MLVSELERKLKVINPDFRIRYKHTVGGRIGANIAGIFLGSKYLIRIPQGEITLKGRYEEKVTEKAKTLRDGTPIGEDKVKFTLNRGLQTAVKLLRRYGHISSQDAYFILDPTS